MSGKTRYCSLCFLLLISIMVLSACSGDEGAAGPAGPAGSSVPFIYGYVDPPYLYHIDNAGDAAVTIQKLPSIATVTVNDYRLFHGVTDMDEAMSYDRDHLPVTPGDEVRLTVSYMGTDGLSKTAAAQVTIPAYITMIDTVGTTMTELDVDTITWNSSAGADGYRVRITTDVTYDDTSGSYQIWYYDVDTIVADTFFVLRGEHLFPPAGQVGRYIGEYGESYVGAINGPCFAGDLCNVTGDGNGFFFGYTAGDWFDVTLLLPTDPSAAPALPSVAETLNHDDQLIDFIGNMVTER